MSETQQDAHERLRNKGLCNCRQHVYWIISVLCYETAHSMRTHWYFNIKNRSVYYDDMWDLVLPWVYWWEGKKLQLTEEAENRVKGRSIWSESISIWIVWRAIVTLEMSQISSQSSTTIRDCSCTIILIVYSGKTKTFLFSNQLSEWN